MVGYASDSVTGFQKVIFLFCATHFSPLIWRFWFAFHPVLDLHLRACCLYFWHKNICGKECIHLGIMFSFCQLYTMECDIYGYRRSQDLENSYYLIQISCYFVDRALYSKGKRLIAYHRQRSGILACVQLILHHEATYQFLSMCYGECWQTG